MAVRRVAVLATHWLGDTFWALQVVPFLRRIDPEAEIHVLVRPQLRWLAALWVPPEHVHGVDGLVSDRMREGRASPRRIWRSARRLRATTGKPHLLIDLTGTWSSALFTRLMAPSRAVGLVTRKVTTLAYHDSRPDREFTGHLAIRPWWLMQPWFGGRDGWPASSEQTAPVLPLPAAQDAPRTEAPILVFPGAGWMQKRWPLIRFAELARTLQARAHLVRVFFALGERRRVQRFEGLLTMLPGPHLTVRMTRGEEMLAELRSAAGVVANDSGAAHLAAAIGLPVVALFGPTNPAICGPLGPRVRTLRTGCAERPEGEAHHCHNTPAYDCPRSCMRSIAVGAVAAAVEAVIRDETLH